MLRASPSFSSARLVARAWTGRAPRGLCSLASSPSPGLCLVQFGSICFNLFQFVSVCFSLFQFCFNLFHFCFRIPRMNGEDAPGTIFACKLAISWSILFQFFQFVSVCFSLLAITGFRPNISCSDHTAYEDTDAFRVPSHTDINHTSSGKILLNYKLAQILLFHSLLIIGRAPVDQDH